VTLSPSGRGTALHVETDIPASVGIENGRLHKLNGDGFAANMHTEFTALAKRLDAGDAPRAAAWSMQMAAHILGQNNRKSTQEAWARVEADPHAYAHQAGIDAANDYIESKNLPPEQEERMKAAVSDALDQAERRKAGGADDEWGAAQ
jgi:hypothetical protein